MKTALLIAGFLLLTPVAFAQRSTIDIVGIHQLVNESISENKLQVAARNRQALATANEQANLSLLDHLKVTYRKLQQRFNILGTAIGLAGTGIYAIPMLSQILSNEQQIFQLALHIPALTAIGYQTELNFAQKAESLLGYIAGLNLTLGDIAQMKAADRKILFDYIIAELSTLQELSANLLRTMQYSGISSLLKAANPFERFMNSDQALARNILQNARFLK
jgi:hypothetical protein